MRTKKTLRATPVISFYFLIFAILMLSVVSSMNCYAQQVARQVPTGYETKFWAYTPPSYDEEGPGHPLLISLHGASSIGDDLNLLLPGVHKTPAYLISESEWDIALPFVVVSPQLKSIPGIGINNQDWPADLVDELIDYVKDQYNIDNNRVYLTGISLGAAGTWNYTAAFPEKVTAILPMGGKTPIAEACSLKDIPTWAFHGDSDKFVAHTFSVKMVESIEACEPSGLFNPKLNLNYTQGHITWNEIYTGSSGYDVYDWLLSFSKNSTANNQPRVYLGRDRKILLPSGPFTVYGEYFDWDGNITNVEWSQVSGPAVTLEDTNTPFLKVSNPTTGTFVFQLTVTDNDNASASKQIQVEVLPTNGSVAVQSLILTDRNGSMITDLSEGEIIYLPQISDDSLNIRATVAGGTSSVRYSVNADQNTRLTNGDNYIANLSDPWGVRATDYLVCATPYSGNAGGGTEGTSLCYKITFSDEVPGLVKFYSKPNANITSTGSWGSNPDGSGSAPSSFTEPNQSFIVSNTASLSGSLTISGTNSKLTVASGGDLLVSNGFSAPFYLEDHSTVRINTGASVSFTSIADLSTIIYENAVTAIPQITYGNLVISGSGTTKTLGGAKTFVKGNLTVNSGVNLNRTSSSSEIDIQGNFDFNGTSNQSFVVTFSGFGVQNFTIPAGSTTFRNVFINSASLVKLNGPPTATMDIDGVTGLRVSDLGKLILNGHTLSVSGTASINFANTKGTIDCDGGSIVINLTSNRTSNIYPYPGKNRLEKLDIISSGNGNVTIRDSLYITESFRINNGTLNTTSLLTLESGPTFTAYVSRITGNPTINGNVNYQRNIEPGRKYKYLGFPVKNLQVADVQESIPITGSFNGTSTGGGMTANPSFFYYGLPTVPADIESGWTEYPLLTNTENLEFGRGYATFIRESAVHKKLVLTGPLHIGDFDYSPVLTPNTGGNENLGWNLVANPYASTITWNEGWTKLNVSPIVYVRDNSTSGGNVWVWGGGAGDDEEFGGVIASGQAFWVRTTNASPTLIITEQAKLEQGDASFYRTGSDDVVSLRIQLKQNDRIDNAYLKFSNAGKVKFDDTLDGVKMKNAHINLSVLSSDLIQTAIKNLCDTLCTQEIGLAVEPHGTGTYSLNTNGNAYDQMISNLYLVDNYIDSVYEWNEGKEYIFQVDENAKSFAQDRFKLIIERNTMEQPVISWHEGALVSSIGKRMQWMLNGEDIPGATAASFYPTVDGDYTVRLTDKACSKVSPAYSFRITGTGNPLLSEVKIYPNPVTNYIRVIGIDRSQAEVAYTITSLSGAVLQRGNVAYEDLSGEGEVKLKSLSTGLYILNVRDTSGARQFKFSVH